MRTETVIIGGGQAGLSLSYHLGRARRPHVLLERGRVGERWRSERWDSLTLLTPNWLSRLDGAPAHADAHAFLGKDAFVRYLERYGRHAPVRRHVEVRFAEPLRDGGFRVATNAGTWLADNVVVATGDSADPNPPPIASPVPALHSSQYRNPSSLASGGVMVVGGGPSGQQLAAELARAGRRVVLSVGGHGRMLRRYRGRDIWYWLDALGDLDQRRQDGAPRPRSLTVSGANGGEQLDLATLHALGVTVTGRFASFDGRTATFADDLAANVGDAERRMSRLLDRIDERFPDWPCAPDRAAPVVLPPPPSSLDLADVGTVIWATGYRRSYPWLHADVLDDGGEIVQCDGITPVPGLYVLGRNFQSRRSSHFIGGVGRDAAFIAALLRWQRTRVGNPARHPFLDVVTRRQA